MNRGKLLQIAFVAILILPSAAGCSSSGTQLPAPASQTPIPATSTPAEFAAPIATVEPTPIKKIPVIYDDDGSPDGTTALLYLLSHPAVDLKAVNLTYGEVYQEIYIQHLGRMLDDFGITGIPLGFGPMPLSSVRLDFPEFLRQSSNNFWGMPIPNADKTYPAQPAPELLVSAIHQSPEPVTIYVAGLNTNLAQALRLDPGIRDNIEAVYIMGGAVYAPGNVHDFYPEHPNDVAEWNFVADPVAARDVFESGLEMYLVPLDATNQVLVTRQDTGAWRQGGEIANFAADIYDMLLDAWGVEEAAIWDLMTAVIMLAPEHCPFVPLHLEVITEAGSSLGQSAVVPDEESNVYVCLEPDADLIRSTLIEVLSKSK